MSFRGRCATLFPLLHLSLCGSGLAAWIHTGCALWCLWILGFLYLFPPIAFQIHQRLWPLQEGWRRLDTPNYSPWWGSLQMQAVFNAAPVLEALLRIVPGCYSLWLRLWGSRIGRAVVWSPRVEISDRALVDIGDRVVFGHRVALYGHVVDRRNGTFFLYAKRIRIGAGAFLGAGSRIGPGAIIGPGVRLPVLTDVRVGEHKRPDPP
ncbi:MAG TPA: hypothetical protein VMN36_15780 [Verrucomicrobiales bacterium]|nr:hypothetical protein [Verrucomicrobiales bacterium]